QLARDRELHSQRIDALWSRIEDLENRSRRNNIRMLGLREGSEGDDIKACIEKILTEGLKIVIDGEFEVERAHRSPAARRDEDQPPRVLMIRFLRSSGRDKVLKAAREKNGATWNGCRLSFFPDMSKSLADKRKAFTPAKRLLHAKKVRFTLAFPAILTFSWRGRKLNFQDATEAEKFIQQRVVSWNINGCGNPVKRKKVLSYLKLQQTDIAFIQETHLKDDEARKFKRDWVGQVFFSSFSTKKNGVLILVHKRLNFSLVREYADSNGRIICIDTIINGMKVTLCNIYAPNKEEPAFFHEVNNILGNAHGQVVLAGDFNQVLDGALDKSRFSGTAVPKDRAAIQVLMKDNGLIDIWRMVNPSKREYSFYSHCHKSYSRIDFILMSNGLINDVIDCKINAISLSDHAPVELCVKIHPEKLKRGRWRMNTSILQNDIFQKELAIDLSSFFEINMGSTDSVAMVWEASKAYIRGKIIAHTSRIKKEHTNTVKKLEAELIIMERKLAEQYSDRLLNDICKCKSQIQEIFNRKAEYALFRLKTTFYEAGEKTGKLLARQLKEVNSAHAIPAIRKDGALVTSPTEINEFNYISMMLPLSIPENIFKQYDNLIKEFLWAGRKPRFKLDKLYAPKDKGGLSLPNMSAPNRVREQHLPLLIKGAMLAQQAMDGGTCESSTHRTMAAATDLTWSNHISTLVKTARQRLYRLRRPRDFKLPLKCSGTLTPAPLSVSWLLVSPKSSSPSAVKLRKTLPAHSLVLTVLTLKSQSGANTDPVCKSKSGSCLSTQADFAEPEPQRVWKSKEEEVGARVLKIGEAKALLHSLPRQPGTHPAAFERVKVRRKVRRGVPLVRFLVRPAADAVPQTQDHLVSPDRCRQRLRGGGGEKELTESQPEDMMLQQEIKTKNDWLGSTSENFKVLLPYLLSKNHTWNTDEVDRMESSAGHVCHCCATHGFSDKQEKGNDDQSGTLDHNHNTAQKSKNKKSSSPILQSVNAVEQEFHFWRTWPHVSWMISLSVSDSGSARSGRSSPSPLCTPSSRGGGEGGGGDSLRDILLRRSSPEVPSSARGR
ncbi:unnamed protein product, partial [Menidia menidia]